MLITVTAGYHCAPQIASNSQSVSFHTVFIRRFERDEIKSK